MLSYARHNGLIGKERHRNLFCPFKQSPGWAHRVRDRGQESLTLHFLFLCGLQPLFYFISQRNYRWLCISREDQVQGNFWSKKCSLVLSGSALLTASPMAHGKSSALACYGMCQHQPELLAYGSYKLGSQMLFVQSSKRHGV